MSEELVSGCIQHKDNRHLRLYNDYMDIYKGNEHKAKIIRILETWTDSKRAEWFKENLDRLEQGQKLEAPDFWITMSYGQFKQFMYGSISEDTLKKNLAELEKSKHITRRVNPDFPYGSPQYLLNAKTVQNALNKRATPPLIPELPQFDTPPGIFLPPQEITPTQGVELPLPRGENTYQPGGNFTPTQGGKSVPSNNSTKNYLESGNNTTKEVASQHFDATPLTPSDFLPDEQLAASYADEQGREMHALAAAFDENHSHFFEQETICLQCGNLTDNPDACTSCQLAETKHRIPTIKLNGATDGHLDTPSRSDDRATHGHALSNGALPPVPVAIASIPGEAADPPTAAIVRQSQTTSKSRVLEGHEQPDGAATMGTGEPRPSDSGHSARAEQASQASLQLQAASVTAQNGAGTRQEKGKEVTQAIQKPLSLKEDEPTVRPETPAQRKRRIEVREKEIWVLVEAGLRTKFTRTHRQLKANTAGMERLIEDETDDATLKEGLEKLSDFWKNQFDLAMFHAKLPGLVRKQTRRLADKSPQNVLDAQYEAALQKTGQRLEDEEVPAWLDFDNYVGNGPEERQRLIERGLELKAQGFCPDL